MEINKVFCLFEQSGTFKNEFRKLGIQAEDYDILNDFGETDHIVDLFHEQTEKSLTFPISLKHRKETPTNDKRKLLKNSV